MPFRTPLRVELLDELRGGRECWRLFEPLVYESAIASATITVPVGFETDCESVPAFLRGIVGRGALKAGIVHDHLYSVHAINGQPIERALADQIYEEACLCEGLDEVRARQRYNAVSFYGASHWKT